MNHLSTHFVAACLLSAHLASAQVATIKVDVAGPSSPISHYMTGACIEDVNHEVYGGIYSQMIFGESFQEPGDVSGMWRAVQRGTARGSFGRETAHPFKGESSQRITFANGDGEIGVENRGLNRWGLALVAAKSYDGSVWARADHLTSIFAALESADGHKVYAEARLELSAGDWQKLAFTLTPDAPDSAGHFAIKLKQPGTVTLGYAFLQPGGWGRFKGLPVRKDVADGLVAQGLTVLRYGGSMVNAPQYRWKQMIGPSDRRPPYKGTWYPYSSNGWGIMDFLNFCQAAGFLPVPAFNMDETPRDMADFVEYVNGPANSPWGGKRAADGHAEPYHLTHVELGNEEAIDESYWNRFKLMAEAIWAKDPGIILVVGDFAYGRPIVDPFHFNGAPRIHTLAVHKKILDLAKTHDREVWFDVHVGTERPREAQGLGGIPSFIEALGRLSPGARCKVAVFELNANRHDIARALSNAVAIGQLERMGKSVPIVCSANCLQCDGQNDNGWDQGLLFLDPEKVWPQPPYFVTQMISRNYLPFCVKAAVQCPGNALDVTVTRSEDGRLLQLQVINVEARPMPTLITFDGFRPTSNAAHVTELTGELKATNAATDPQHVQPSSREWRYGTENGVLTYTFPPTSFTMIRFD